MKIYHFDAFTGEYKGTSDARESPLEPGKFLIPANATTTAPRTATAGNALVYLNDAWSQVADHRGEKWFDASATEVEIEALGDPVAGGLSKTKPDIVPTRAAANTERERRIATGFAFGGKTFDFNATDKARVTGTATLAGFAIAAGAQAGDLRWHGGTDDFRWIATDNSLVAMDAQTAFAFGQAAANWESEHIFACLAIKADIDTGTITTLAAVKTDSRWP